MMLFIILVILGSIWYSFLVEKLKNIFGVRELLIVAISLTILTYFIFTKVFKIPFSAIAA